MRWLLKAAGLPLALAPSVALPLLLVAAAEDTRAPGVVAEEAYRALPELPSAAPADTAGDLESAAVELAASLRAVPLDESGTDVCAADQLAVSWTQPGDAYEWGAHVDPVGPAPTSDTTAVNGVVVCEGSDFAFMGFEAWRTDGDWELAAVPYVHEEGTEHDHEAPTPGPQAPHTPGAPAAPPPAVPAPAVPSPLSLDLPTGAIEGYAAYEPQRLCDPTPKAGTLALRNLLLGNNPGTRNLGISRACGAGGQSEHKEGRALDWGVLVTRAAEKGAAETFIAQLMATDGQGNRHALARRMGVMYVIWNRQIWSAYRASAGWRAYGGPSPHTDHVHISLSWAGAQGRTSFWSGKVDPSILLAYRPPMPSGGIAPVAAPAVNTRRRRDEEVLPGTLPTEAVRDALDEGRRRGRRDKDGEAADRRRRWEELSEDERQALLARRAEAEDMQRAERAERKAAREAERADEQAEREAERAERRAAREAERNERQALRDAHKEAERRAEERQEAEREAERQAQREAQRQVEEQRRAEREAQREAERQRKADAQHQREAEKQAERQRRADSQEQRRGERRAEVEQPRRRGGEQAGEARGQGGGERRGGKSDGKGKGGGKGK